MNISGDCSPSQRSSSQSPGKQRNKYDPGSQTRGRDRTRANTTNGGGETQGSGRSPSNSRLCWNCDEVVTGDHYASTCTKPKKKEEPNRSITHNPRGRSGSKERQGASQGGETNRMMQGSIGSKPWTAMSSAAAALAAETAASAAASPAAAAALDAGETSAAIQYEVSPTSAAALDEIEEIESKDEDEDEKARNEETTNQWLIDDVVKELIEMELKQREKEGETEGFEAGSEHWL